MKLRNMCAALVLGGIPWLTGCVDLSGIGGLLDGLSSDGGSNGGSSGGAIKDGTYAGTSNATANFYQGNALYDQQAGNFGTNAKFSSGALLNDSGGWYKVGGVDRLQDGTYDLTRKVTSVDYGDWGYEIAFDESGTFGTLPMTGWEVATYWLNADGSLDLYDEIELTSTTAYYGNTLTIHTDGYATLTRGSVQSPSQPQGQPQGQPQNQGGGSILDLKSGKIKH